MAAEQLKWSTSNVRSTFIQHFQKNHAHQFHPSSPLIPYDDSSLLFINAGMNQFKPLFLGLAAPNSPLKALQLGSSSSSSSDSSGSGAGGRAVNSQKCIRAGGKHNDLEDVGKDTYHHTFFEMLGCWSLSPPLPSGAGGYGKEEMIPWAFDLLTRVYGIDPARLYVTYFEGSESMGVPPDLATRDIWLKAGISADRIIACGSKDNFWEMGETGPCGPCTEIHYDRIGSRDASQLVNADDASVIEIWNIVFILYNREEGGGLKGLNGGFIDTGMGLERLASILQDKSSNYDTDTFSTILRKLEVLSDEKMYTGKVGVEDKELKDQAFRACADHARAVVFALSDGVIPSNEGRGYVIRRIIRRALRHGTQVLGCKPGFLSEIVDTVVDEYEEFYSELGEGREVVKAIVKEEEASFNVMLVRGIKYLDDLTSSGSEERVIGGKQIFYMYDTLGFPVDLISIMAVEKGYTVALKEFEIEMEAQKSRSREDRFAKKVESGGGGLGGEQVTWLGAHGVRVTDDDGKYQLRDTRDGGDSDGDSQEAKILAIFDPNFTDGVDVGFISATAANSNSGSSRRKVGLVLDKTNFYATAGGQECDTGTISSCHGHGGKEFMVESTEVFAGYVLHFGSFIEGEGDADADSSNEEWKIGSQIRTKPTLTRRNLLTNHHTSTHLLNHALRQTLNSAVDQKGSLITEDKLRFDFTSGKPLTAVQISEVEEIVNGAINKNLKVNTNVMPLAEATKIEGVRAVFGESYPDPVRVVSIVSDSDASASPSAPASVEFCGGTHTPHTGALLDFVVIEESAVGKGVRRLVCVTGANAEKAREAGRVLSGRIAMLEKELKFASKIASGGAGLELEVGGLEAKIIAVKKELESVAIGYVDKAELRSRIGSATKAIVDAKKKLESDAITSYLHTLTQALEDGGSVVLTEVVPKGITAKGGPAKVAEGVRKLNDGGDVSYFGIIGSEEDDSVTVFTSCKFNGGVSAGGSASASVSASDWLNAILSRFGGKGGGNMGFASGKIPRLRLNGGLEGEKGGTEMLKCGAREEIFKLYKLK